MAGPSSKVQQAVTSAEHRALMSAFPTGVAVVTALDADGDPCGMTCSSLASVTMSPPTLLVCLRVGSRTADAVRLRGRFAVNLLRAEARRVSEIFSSPIEDRFSQVRWEESASGLPRLVADAFATAECVVSQSLTVGDHAVVFGHTQRVTHSDDTPLLYGLRQYSAFDARSPAHDHAAYTGLCPRRQEEAP